MATSLPKIFLQTIRSPSPAVLLSSAALHFWSGDNVDGGAALALCLLKVAALSWTRFWTSTVEAQIGGEQQPGDAEKAATAAGRVCTLAGGALAFYLFLADPESVPSRSLGRSLVVFNTALSLGALPLALRLRLSQTAVNLTGARPRSFGAIERASRLRLLFTRGALPEAIEDVRCVLFGEQHAQAEGALQAADMAPACHRRDRRVRECTAIASSRPEDIEEALLILSTDGQVGVHESPAAINLPPSAVTFGGEGADFHVRG